jgi:hypothetical protein
MKSVDRNTLVSCSFVYSDDGYIKWIYRYTQKRMHSLNIISANHANMQKCVNTEIKILNSNANIF